MDDKKDVQSYVPPIIIKPDFDGTKHLGVYTTEAFKKLEFIIDEEGLNNDARAIGFDYTKFSKDNQKSELLERCGSISLNNDELSDFMVMAFKHTEKPTFPHEKPIMDKKHPELYLDVIREEKGTHVIVGIASDERDLPKESYEKTLGSEALTKIRRLHITPKILKNSEQKEREE